MAQLEDTLNCVSNSTNPVPAGNCTDANGPAMYQSLIDNYMQDPNTLVDVWGPLTNTLYLFAFTIVSTIGYGTFAPKTAGGQIFTIFYALVRCVGAVCAADRFLTRCLPPQFSIPVGGVLLGKLAGTLLELGEWACYTMFSGRIRAAYKEANKNGDGILDYDDMRLAIMKAQGHEIDPGDFNSAVKENDKFETHDISHSNFVHIYLKVDKEEMQEARAADRAKVCSLMVLGWLLLGMRYFGRTEGWTMVEAFYFGIVTLTTIGFGDYVPTTPAGDAFHFLFCIFGLGLVATLLGAISALAADSGGGDEEEEEGGGDDDGGKAKKGGDDEEEEEDTPRKPGRASSGRRKAPHPKSGLAGVAMMQEGASRRHLHGGGGGGKGKRAPSVISEEEEEEEDEPAPATPSTPTGLFGLPMVDFGAAMPWLNGGQAPPPAPTAKAARKPVREDSVTSSIAPPPKAKRSAKRDEPESPKAGKGKGKWGKGKRMDADL